MPKKRTKRKVYFGGKAPVAPIAPAPGMLLGLMKDGREYSGLLEAKGFTGVDARGEIRLAIAEVEAIRGRPLLVYAANVIKALPDASVSIDLADSLPFGELVDAVPAQVDGIDIAIITPGGLAQQVSHFVGRLRPRFKDVAVLVPHMAMSAGTIWALSGNEIWMDERAFLGPIDPQVPGKDGRYIPAQALLTLLKRIQDTGEQALKSGQNPPWSDIQILHQIDAKEIGNTLALSDYAIQLAANYLETHKFRDWTTHHDGRPVSADDKKNRAIDIATRLCSHEQWKVHGHGLSRQVVENELQLRIGHPEDVSGFERALRRLWALLYWLFENTPLAKIYISGSYSLFRSQPQPGGAA